MSTDAPAPFWRRAVAVLVDLGAALVLSRALSSTLGLFFANRAVVTLRIGEQGTFWQGPVPMLLGIFGELVYLMPLVVWFVWSLDALTGATPGKRLLGLRVERIDRQPMSQARRWRRVLIQTAACWGWTLGLLTGIWQIAFVLTVAGLIVWLGTLLALTPSHLALHDRLTSTTVRTVLR